MSHPIRIATPTVTHVPKTGARASIELGDGPGRFVIVVRGLRCPCGCGYEMTMRLPVEIE